MAEGDDGYFFATSIISGKDVKIQGITRTESIYEEINAFMPVMQNGFNDGVQDVVATSTTERNGLLTRIVECGCIEMPSRFPSQPL